MSSLSKRFHSDDARWESGFGQGFFQREVRQKHPLNLVFSFSRERERGLISIDWILKVKKRHSRKKVRNEFANLTRRKRQ